MTSAAQGPVTHARVWKIAGPIVLSNATVPLLGISCPELHAMRLCLCMF